MTITIAFYLESETYRWMAEVAVASARKAMPQARIVQLSLADTSNVIGADELIVGTDADMLGRSFLGRYFALAPHVRGDFILANCDVAFLKSVEHVFDMPGDWSIAAPHIASPDVRFDGGLIFARNDRLEAQRLWNATLMHPACSLPDKHVNEQLAAFNTPLELLDRERLLRVLPGVLYSYVPKNEFDPALGAYVVHARGPRKKWLCHYAGLSPALANSYLEGREAIGLPVTKGGA